MHELGTVIYIMDEVQKIAEENKLTFIESVTIEVGEVTGIVPFYLEDFWNYSKKKSEILKDSTLKIEKIDAVTYCENCSGKYSTVKYAKICPYCGSDRTYLIQGNEFNIKEIEAM